MLWNVLNSVASKHTQKSIPSSGDRPKIKTTRLVLNFSYKKTGQRENFPWEDFGHIQDME